MRCLGNIMRQNHLSLWKFHKQMLWSPRARVERKKLLSKHRKTCKHNRRKYQLDYSASLQKLDFNMSDYEDDVNEKTLLR